MKKLILLVLCAVMCISPLASCGGDDVTTAKPEETTAYDYDKIPEVIEPHEEKTVTADELGYTAAVLSGTTKYWVADAKVDENGGVIITSYNPGETVITVKNKYSEKVEITVTVGLDYSIEAVNFEKFEMPEKYVYASDYGMKPSVADNASALQAAINALPDGGTVYIPKGVYYSTIVELKENITLRLEGALPEYNTKFTSALAGDIIAGKFACIKAIKGDMFINHEPHGFGKLGADNIAIYGGVLDMMGKSRCFIWCCGDNLTLENVIMKDCLGDHAIQITGSTNVTIRDCMFAGYAGRAASSAGGGETIQIEQAHSGAIGGAWDVTNSKFYDNEYYYSGDVLIENCYFGPSINYGSHATPIGHHGQAARCSATGVRILGCTFENPLVSAIRPYSWTNVEIANNTFISNTANSIDPEKRYMIDMIFTIGAVNLPTGVSLAVPEERGGCQNYDIHDNTFEISGGSQMYGIIQANSFGNIACDAKAYVKLRETDYYKDPAHLFTGYKMVTSVNSDITFRDNEITIDKDLSSIYRFSATKGLKFENNTINSDNQFVTSKIGEEEVYGGKLVACTTQDSRARTFVVSALSSNTTVPITATTGDGDIEMFCTASSKTTTYNITFSASEGGTIGRSATDDGQLYVEPIAEDGYVFDGYYVGDAKIEPGRFEFDTTTTVEMKFVKE